MATKVGFQLESSLASKHLTDATFIKGSYLVVSTTDEMNTLPVASDTTDGIIVEGSLCYCQKDDKFYIYTGSAWEVKEFGTTNTATESADGLMSAADKQKLKGIAVGAEVNVQSDWNQTNSNADDYIKNKPTIPTVPEWAKKQTKPTLSEWEEDDTYKHVTAAEKTAWNAKSDFSGNYEDLSNKPVIPTVNNGTLTIQKNGTNVVVFGANQAGEETANIIVPTKTSDLTNDSGFITGFEEIDPTVPNWAKAASKPSYNLGEVSDTSNFVRMTPTERTKLSGIATGAEVNVQSDWNITDTSSDAYIKNKPTIPTTLKNPNALSIGGKTYDGSVAVSVTASDLGIANAIHFIGETTTTLTDGTTTAAVTINGVSKTPVSGDVVLSGSKEFIWNGSAWKELGDGSSHALKTVTITAGNGLTGGGDISTNRTLAVGAGNGITVNADTIEVKYGTTSGTACEGNDSRLSDARTPTAHNQASSSINAMTGYSKPASTGAIATSDTLNAAIGKLEKALDGKQASGSYSTTGHKHTTEEITDFPTIPTVNNGTLTIQKNGTDVATFTANQSSAATANITVPTKTSELTNDSGFKTTDTNTTYDLAASKSSTNGNVKVNLTAGGSGSGTDSVMIKGAGATTVTTDADGVITISSTDTNTQDGNDNQTVKTGNVTFGINDVVEFKAGSNVSISGDAANKTITISATDTNTQDGNDNQKIKVGNVAFEENDTVEFVGNNITITPDAANDKVTFELTQQNVINALGFTPNGTTIEIDSKLSDTSENPVQNKVITEALKSKVEVVTGKGLSTNDYTSADKEKLDRIDLDKYQTKTDENLNTTNKTVVGAINELNTDKATLITEVFGANITTGTSRIDTLESNITNLAAKNELSEAVEAVQADAANKAAVVLSESQKYTDALANGQVALNKNDIETLLDCLTWGEF